MSAPAADPDGQPARLKLGRRLLDLFGRGIRIDFRRGRRPWQLAFADPWHVFLITLISALCGTGVIVLLNAEAENFAKRQYDVTLAVAFVALLISYQYSQRTLIRKAAEAIEEALHERRVGISARLMSMDVAALYGLSRAAVTNGLAKNFEVLSQSLVPLLLGLQSVILLVLMTGYLFWQSVIAGLLSVTFAVLLVVNYIERAGELQKEMASAAAHDAELSELANEVFAGFKELRFDPAKEAAISREIEGKSRDVARWRASTADLIGAVVTTADSASYLLAAAVIFILPIVSDSSPSALSRILTTVLFVLGPLGGVAKAAQQVSAAQVSLRAINDFERRLDEGSDQDQTGFAPPHTFEGLELKGVSYSYPSSGEEAGFRIAPIDIDLRPGEIVFITGGNGSGKTTALRVLTGLYPAEAGRILLNGVPVERRQLAGYRQVFSTVFADFHVFRKPYGLDDARLAAFERNLVLLDIRDKLPDDLRGGYDPNALSTGQRKRLALALAMAEDRPIIILDEWAADQDPQHRAMFYETILPQLRQQGRAVLAVTHDERYFDLADRRYHMQDNALRRLA